MSIRMNIAEVTPEEGDTAKDAKEKMEEHLAFYAKKHPEFSYEIKEDIERNKVIVKTVNLDDNAN